MNITNRASAASQYLSTKLKWPHGEKRAIGNALPCSNNTMNFQMSPETCFDGLVSVIIPCYNQGKYLSDAIDSVLSQNHKNVEVIVIDDGSTDCTRQVVERKYPGRKEIKYIYQNNQGLSAARNTGIDNSKGDYFVFLDADDWLVGDALRINLLHLKHDESAAFVSGGHVLVNERLGPEVKKHERVDKDHFLLLLQRNYISMHGTVMYRQWVFNEFRFDTSLKAAEDYDMYLKIARKYPVRHHTEIIAAYRFHDSNMSADALKMYTTILTVLKRQQQSLKDAQEKQSFKKGLNYWRSYYSSKMLTSMQQKSYQPFSMKMFRQHWIVFRYCKLTYLRYFVKTKSPAFLLRWVSNEILGRTYTPYPGRTNRGDFQRLTPFNNDFGYSRGGPVDRYYIENFLKSHARYVRGRVLEIGDSLYTKRYGGDQVSQSDVLDIQKGNLAATFAGDLSDAPQLPSNSFDCIILTQTLHIIYDFKGALKTCHRILKPGGILLLTVPGITQIDQSEWIKPWMWSFTSTSINRLLHETFTPDNDVEVNSGSDFRIAYNKTKEAKNKANILVNVHGNILAVNAFLYAMGVSELTKAELDFTDPQYQLVITATATKTA